MKYCKIWWSGQFRYMKLKNGVYYSKELTMTSEQVKEYVRFFYKDKYITKSEYENGLLKQL